MVARRDGTAIILSWMTDAPRLFRALPCSRRIFEVTCWSRTSIRGATVDATAFGCVMEANGCARCYFFVFLLVFFFVRFLFF